MNRPTGVTVIAVLDFVAAGLEVLCAILMFLGGAFLGTILGSMAGRTGSGAAGAGAGAVIGAALGVFCLVFAAISGTVGFGLWNLKEWGRILQIIFAAIGALFQVLGLLGAMIHFRMGAMLWNVIWLAFHAWVIFYLVQPQIKAAFAPRAAFQPAVGD